MQEQEEERFCCSSSSSSSAPAVAGKFTGGFNINEEGERGRSNVQISVLPKIRVISKHFKLLTCSNITCLSRYQPCHVLLFWLSYYLYRKSSKNAATPMRKMSTMIKMRFSKVHRSSKLHLLPWQHLLHILNMMTTICTSTVHCKTTYEELELTNTCCLATLSTPCVT